MMPAGFTKLCASWIALAALSLVACANRRPYELGQPIEMGPYTFSVSARTDEQTKSGKRFDGVRWVDTPITELTIRFEVLRDDAKPFTTDFNRFFLRGMRIEDAAGNRFGVTPVPIAPVYRGGRYHAQSYSASVRLDPSMMGVHDPKALGSRARDFRLFIDNPDRQSGQPSSVVVQLR